MSPELIGLDISDRLHCDLFAERVVERGSDNIIRVRQYRDCLVEPSIMVDLGLFPQPR
jgi:hypothetical protein